MAIQKKKKRFFEVEIPIIGKTTFLQAFTIEELQGRFIKYDLTRVLRGKSLVLQAKVSVQDEKAVATPTKANLLQYFLKRMVRKGTDYVEDSFSTECQDAQIRIKPFLITRRKVSRAVRKALRETAKQELITYSKEQKAEHIFSDLLNNKLQKDLSLKLKKIYPLSLCEIRILKVEKYLKTTNKAEEKTETPKETKKEIKEEKTEAETEESKKPSKKKVVKKKTAKKAEEKEE